MKQITIFISLLFFNLISFSQEVTFNFNYENAKQTLNLLEKENLTIEELNTFAKLEGSKALEKKINENSGVIIEAIEDANCKVFDKKYMNFQYREISENIEKLREFIFEIENKQPSIEAELIESYKQYLNPNEKYTFNVYILMGGYSSGFTFGDENNFYIGTHLYKQDFKSITLTCKHELFHNIQSLLYDPQPVAKKLEKANLSYVYAHGMINYIFKEGTAEYIGSTVDYYEHQITEKNNHPHIKELYDQAVVNKYRIKGINYLINYTILDIYKNKELADTKAIYQLLFDWNWNNPAYYAGEKMIASLTKEIGEKVLKEYLEKDPIYFFNDYIVLSKNNKENYPIQFTDEFANMVYEIKNQIEVK